MSQRVPVGSFRDVALSHLDAVSRRVPLRSAVLDRWGGAVRIVYGCEYVERCAPACEPCELRAVLGEDTGPVAPNEFRPGLRRATAKQLETFSAKQRMMNCKTLDQYATAFVEWLVHRCPTRPSLEAEAELVFGFRLLVKDGRPATAMEEREVRLRIVREAIAHPFMGVERRMVLRQLVDQRCLAGTWTAATCEGGHIA